jgi:hypothetical protein
MLCIEDWAVNSTKEGTASISEQNLSGKIFDETRSIFTSSS